MKVGECKECSWWQPTELFGKGECHKGSPGSYIGELHVTLFPVTKASNWCGCFHFKPAQDGARQPVSEWSKCPPQHD